MGLLLSKLSWIHCVWKCLYFSLTWHFYWTETVNSFQNCLKILYASDTASDENTVAIPDVMYHLPSALSGLFFLCHDYIMSGWIFSHLPCLGHTKLESIHVCLLLNLGSLLFFDMDVSVRDWDVSDVNNGTSGCGPPVPDVLFCWLSRGPCVLDPEYCSLALTFVTENAVTHLLFQCENLHLVLYIFRFFA